MCPKVGFFYCLLTSPQAFDLSAGPPPFPWKERYPMRFNKLKDPFFRKSDEVRKKIPKVLLIINNR
jgi:hypothetical protein